MLTCKLFQNFFLARVFRFWNYSLSVSSVLLNSSRVLIAGLSFLMCSASTVSNLMLLNPWSINFHLNSVLPHSLPHCVICCRTGVSSFRCSSIHVVRCRTVWPTEMDLHPQHSSLYTTFGFSSLEKGHFREGIQVFIFLVNIICALVISRTDFANV